MDKEAYLNKIKLNLSSLPNEEIKIILDYYEKLIENKRLQNETETILNEKIGHPSVIAKAILDKFKRSESVTYTQQGWQEIKDTTENVVDNTEHPRPRNSFFKYAIQLLALIFINLFFMFWLILTVFICLLVGWLCSLAFIISPLILLGAYFTSYLSHPLLSFSISLVLFGLGIIGFYLCKVSTKYFWRFCKYYSKINLNVLRGEH